MKVQEKSRNYSFSLFAGLMVIISVLSTLSACVSQPADHSDRLEKIDFESKILQKNMQLLVWLPKNMSNEHQYPVLYFLPDYGGSANTVIHEYEIGQTADELTGQNLIEPMIIVAVSMDSSFGINSATTVRLFETDSGKTLSEGPYEDYFINEIIPLIDSRFSTQAQRSGRMIGGYSMGGFAALYLAFHHPDLFCKAGGHSATLFTDDLPDRSVSEWLYPDDRMRDARDPIRLAQNCEFDGLAVYLDTGESDPNRNGNACLAEILQKRQVTCENHIFPGVHGRLYCQNWMKDYLEFYGNTP